MTTWEAIQARHAVRQYVSRPITAQQGETLAIEIAACNQRGSVHMQLLTEERLAFSGRLARYGKFSGVENYIALVGPKGPQLEEDLGYYGERVALTAQTLGLNTCWVALSFGKGIARTLCEIGPEETLVGVLTLGYGASQGIPHRSRPMEKLCRTEGPMPDWFRRGMEAAMLAPTAMNQQRFLLTLVGERVRAKAAPGFFTKMDLGIVKYHFEVGAERGREIWLP